MNSYLLTASALHDLREIISYLPIEAGEALAFRIEDELYSSLKSLQNSPVSVIADQTLPRARWPSSRLSRIS